MFKQLVSLSLATLALGVAQTASAHTGIKDSVMEGASVYTASTLGHACQDGSHGAGAVLPKKPVVAQSMVAPYGTQVKLANFLTQSGVVTTLLDAATGAVAGNDVPLEAFIAGYDSAVGINLALGGVQGNELFKTTTELPTDNLYTGATVKGIQYSNSGAGLQMDLVGLAPFRVTAPKINPNACVRSIKIRYAIANYCTSSANTSQDNRADIWAGRLTAKFNDAGIQDANYWPTQTVNRDFTTNPYPKTGGNLTAADIAAGKNNCKYDAKLNPTGIANGSTIYDAVIEPSGALIDAYLPMDNYWPGNTSLITTSAPAK